MQHFNQLFGRLAKSAAQTPTPGTRNAQTTRWLIIIGGVMVGVIAVMSIYTAAMASRAKVPAPEAIASARSAAGDLLPAPAGTIKTAADGAASQTAEIAANGEPISVSDPFSARIADFTGAAKGATSAPTSNTGGQPANNQLLLRGGGTSERMITAAIIANAGNSALRPQAPNGGNPSGGNNGTDLASNRPSSALGATRIIPEFAARYEAWRQSATNARLTRKAEPSLAAVYAIAELKPLGVVAAGERRLVMVSVSAPKPTSLPLTVGARLYDGYLAAIKDDGVIFTYDAPTPPTDVATPDSPAAAAVSAATSIRDVFVPYAATRNGSVKSIATEPPPRSPTNSANDKPLFGHAAVSQGTTIQAPGGAPGDDFFCDANYVGEPFRYTEYVNLTFGEFITALQTLYQVNFLLDKDVATDVELPLKVSNVPWNQVLRAVMRSLNLQARCLDGGLIAIEPKGKQAKLDAEQEKSEPTELVVYNLRYLLPNSSSGIVIASQVGGGGGFGGAGSSGGSGSGGSAGGSSVEQQIDSLLRASGDPRAKVVRVPNRNALAVIATRKQQEEVAGLLKILDQPGFQVVLETNFYTVQRSNLTDVGGQLSAIVGTGTGLNSGGIQTLSPSGGTDTGGRNPGGVTTLPEGFGQVNNSLRAGSPSTLFGGSFTVGTATFNALISAAEERGIANVQSRTTQTVLDGGTTEISAGDTIIIPTSGSVGGSLINAGAVTVSATQSARMQPLVAVDNDGNPIAVTLNVQLTNNSINRAFAGSANPVVATQTQSGSVRLPLDQTYIIGGFFVDSVANRRFSTPGVSRIPLLGQLFKRRLDQVDRNRLYFAITVRVVRDTALENVPTPADINTKAPAAPAPQKPPVPRADDRKGENR